MMLVLIQIFVAAIRNDKLKLPDDPNELYEIERETTQPEVARQSSNQKNQQPGIEQMEALPRHTSGECQDHRRPAPHILQHHHNEHFRRIGVGLVLACLSMATAALVEVKRKHVAAAHGMLDAIPVMQPLPISIFWLTFQYFIFGMADVFTYVWLLELKALKPFASSFLWCSLSFVM